MLRLFSHSQPGDGLGAERCVSPPHLEVYEMWRGGGLPHLKLARLPTFLPPLPRWVWGLQHTTLAHSLLMVSCTPLLIAGWAGVTGQPLSRMEVGKPVHTVPPHPALFTLSRAGGGYCPGSHGWPAAGRKQCPTDGRGNSGRGRWAIGGGGRQLGGCRG